ncbi:MAG: F0F1 ATP synthase subunit A [Clostridiales bacterium]|nr:F0F1 ATP synthase subunit A [Clostridiales bacterium]
MKISKGRRVLAIKNKKLITIIIWLAVILALFAGVFLTGNQGEKHETVKEMMRDAVLHDLNHISFLGIKEVNPAFISALVITAVLLISAAFIRLFFIPRLKYIPSKFQLLLEQMVGLFDNFAKTNSPHQNGFLGAYIFGAGMYIFFGTMFELIGFQAFTTEGYAISLPAPLSDINGAIAMGCLSYLIILIAGIVTNGFKGLGSTLKDFSMPLSMSFRLFGAMLSGVLVTELVYYYLSLSFVLPVIVGVLFTLLHAIIQTYVLVMLTASTYGEATKPKKKQLSRHSPVSGGFQN